MAWNRVSLGTWMRYPLVRKSLKGTALNGGVRLCGKFELMVMDGGDRIPQLDCDDAQHVMQTFRR